MCRGPGEKNQQQQEGRQAGRGPLDELLTIFYLSCASGSQIKTARRLQYPHILINYATKHNRPPTHDCSLFVDCGGFYSSLVSGMYLTPDQDYLEYIQRHQPALWALRDYPCEPQLLGKWGRTVAENIRRTVEHHLALLEAAQAYDIKGQAVPVVQGWRVADYLDCLDEFRDQGLIKDYMAIGSVCRRGQVGQIRKIVATVRRYLPARVRLHGFGIKLSALKERSVWEALHSVDSGAWDYEARWRKHRGELSVPDASYIVAKEYLRKIDNLQARNRSQATLLAYSGRCPE